MADVELKVGAVDDGFTQLLKGLQEALRRLGSEARSLTRDQVKDAREAATAALESQRKQAQALRDTIAAGKDAVRQERDAGRERVQTAKENLAWSQEYARSVASNTRAAVQAARDQGTAARTAARESLAAAKERRDAEVGAARDVLRDAQANARAQREAGLAGIQSARSVGESLRAEARRNLTARKADADEQRAQGRAILQSTREQVRAEVDAARDIVRVNVQRTRELREQFREQVADAKRNVIDRKRALQEANAAGTGTAVIQGQLQGARDRLTAVRESRDSVLGGSRADTENARASVEAIKSAGREKIAASQAVVRAVTEEMQANIRAAASAVAAAKESASAKVSAAKQAAAAANEAAASEVRAARELLDAQVRAGKISVDDARKQFATAVQTANVKVEGAKRAATAANQEAEVEVNASKRALTAAVTAATGRVRAAEQAAAAAKKEQGGLLANARLIAEEAKARVASLTSMRAQERGLGSLSGAMRSQQNVAVDLIGQLKRLAVQYGAIQAIHAFVREGLEFNQTLETATLGIGALITAEAKLTDSTGRELDGREALNAAMGISEGQMQRLRIAGLQTAATTEELVKAMQQAVGPGLAAGGSIDQIRNFTIQITQAAGAIGLPFHQLNEEVRSLLAGTINYNTRIAKSLGITNAMVREWKNQGVLFDELNARFRAFNTAGERSLRTMQVLRSTLTETFQVFAGASTKPFFEALRVEGFKALSDIFNFDTAKINDKFAGIVRTLQTVFQSAGNIVTTLIRNAITGAEELSAWFDRNRESVQGVVAALEGIVRSLGNILNAITSYVAGFIKAGVETGKLEALLRSIDKFLGFIVDHAQGILRLVIAIKAVNVFESMLTSASPLGVAIKIIGAAFLVVDQILPSVQQKYEALVRTIDNGKESIRDASAETAKLGLEFFDLAKQSQNPKLGGEALAQLRQRQATLVREMIKLNPGIAQGLQTEKLGTQQLTDAVLNLVHAREESLRVSKEVLEVDLGQSRGRLQALDEEIKRLDKLGPLFISQKNAAVDRYNTEAAGFNRLRHELDATDQKISEVNATRNALNVDVAPNRAEVDPDKNARRRDAAIKKEADAAVKTLDSIYDRFKARSDLALEEGTLSYKQYYDGLVALTKKNLDDQIAIRKRQQSLTTDPASKDAIKEQIKQLENELVESADRINKERLQKERDLQTEVAQIRARAAEAENNTASARIQQLSAEFAKRRALLAAQHTEAGEEGKAFIDQIFQVEYAKARLNDLQAVLATGGDQITTVTDQIDVLHSQGAISAEESNRLIAASYQRQIDLLKDIIPEMRQFALLASDEKALDGIRKLELELAKLEIQQREASSLTIQLGHAARRGFEEALNGVFEGMFKEGQTIKKALAEFGIAILQAMNDTLAPQLAQTLTAKFNEAFNDLGSSAAGHFVASFARIVGRGLRAVFDAVFDPIFNTIKSGLSAVLAPVFSARTAATPAAEAGVVATAARALDPIQVADLAAEATKSVPEQAAAIQQEAAATAQLSAAAAMDAAVIGFGTAVGIFATAAGAMAGSGIAGVAAGAIPIPEFAGGGLIGGMSPHSRADDKLVRLTAREFVHPVPTVQYYGLSSMEAIRRRLIPREVMRSAMGGLQMPALTRSYRGAHLADGGLVTGSAGGGREVRGGVTQVDLRVTSNDSHIVSVMKSKPGVRATIENARLNKNAMHRVLSR